jgi:hypothetical protein
MAVDEALAVEMRSNSVKQLCDLYRVVIAISVGIAFHAIVDPAASPFPVRPELLALFGALLITIIPFFHGAVRHLFATYVEGGGSSRVKNWAILIDYYLLFVQGGLFVALASTLDSPESFRVVLIAILGLDVIWGVLAVLGFAGTSSQKAEMKWAAINFAAVVVLVPFHLFCPAFLTIEGITNETLVLLTLLISVLRTIVDYGTNIGFYCPGPATAN